MKSKTIDITPKTFILVFEIGDERPAGLLQFAREQNLSAASFKAVGARSRRFASHGSVGKASGMNRR